MEENIRKFKFNICPENYSTSIKGYITMNLSKQSWDKELFSGTLVEENTEKIMNCCLVGAIPIYFGSFNDIYSKIFNKNRILFYNPDDIDSIEKIKKNNYIF